MSGTQTATATAAAATTATGAALPFDAARAAAFEERLVDALNAGALCIMTSIGHRTGLFDTLAAMPPANSHDIAARAGLDERYVREWLGAMTAGGVIEHDPATGTFRLPPEHAGFLTRAAAPNNMAVYAQYVPLLGTVEDDVIRCFRDGGGVPYTRYPRFHEVMAEDSGQTVLPALFEHILPLVPDITARLEAGIDMLDVGCGRGKALMLMAESFPNSRFVGYDLSEEATSWAREQAAANGLRNIRFVARDLSDFDSWATPDFDFITTFDAVHDQAKPANVLRGIRRSLRQGGVYLAQDINGSSHVHNNVEHPIGTLIYTISCLHCMTVSLAQGGDGLGAMWGRETAERMFRDAGFGSVEVHELPHDFQNLYYVCRP